MPATSTTLITSVKLDKRIQERVQRLAFARQQTPDALIAEAIEQYVERQEKREQFLLDTLASLEHYERTGLHLTGEEVDEWIERLRDDPNAPAPECHV